MTVRELIEELSKYPQDADVWHSNGDIVEDVYKKSDGIFGSRAIEVILE